MNLEKELEKSQGAALSFQALDLKSRNLALMMIAKALKSDQKTLFESNKRDLNALKQNGGLHSTIAKRLLFDGHKIDSLVSGINDVIKMPDPLNKVTLATELDKGLSLYRVTFPIGVIGVILESRPDALVQIATLCLKSGNAVVLKGGSESLYSNRALVSLIKEATKKAGIPDGWIMQVQSREETRELLKYDKYVDLIVARGSNQLVKYVMSHTKIPVIGHTEGMCHTYIDKDADLDTAVRVCVDAKFNYPAVCNSTKFILVHKDVAAKLLPKLAKEFISRGSEIRCCDRSMSVLKKAGISKNVRLASEKDWHTEFLDLRAGIKMVDDLESAIDWVNSHNSKHTDAIVTQNRSAAMRFAKLVDSSSVMVNASTRFNDGYRYGFGCEVGISNEKIPPRGPVGIDGLVTYKYVVLGKGHTVGEYMGKNPRRFTHRSMSDKPEKLDFEKSLNDSF